MSGYEKTAILLLSLGEEMTSDIFSRLDEVEIKKLGAVMSGINNVPADVIEEVHEEFSAMARESALISNGDRMLKNVLCQVLGEKRGKEVLNDLRGKPGALAGISHLHPRILAQIIGNEHPQTIAMILAHLEPAKCVETLSFFPGDLKKSVIMRIATLETVSPEAIEEVEEVLKREMKSIGAQYGEKVGGTKFVAEVLNLIDKTSEEYIFEKMEEEDPDLAGSIKDLMLVFEDLIGVDDRGIQTILKEVNNEQLLLALKTVSDELKEKIFRNMSERAAEMLKEDMEAIGPVKLSDVEAAQHEIVNVARKLEEQGKIAIGGKGGEDVLV